MVTCAPFISIQTLKKLEKYLNINEIVSLKCFICLSNVVFFHIWGWCITLFTHKEYRNKYVGFIRHDSKMATLIIFLSIHDMARAHLCKIDRNTTKVSSKKT